MINAQLCLTKHNCAFIIQKLKNKHTFLKNIQTEKAEEPLILTEREETKTRYFAPYTLAITYTYN
jgi:hypothetical protein